SSTEKDGVPMKTFTEELEEMRLQMNDWAKNEADLLSTLRDGLSEADNKLLDQVRSLVSEHEARRTAILKELQRLASRLGGLSTSALPFALDDKTPAKKLTAGEQSAQCHRRAAPGGTDEALG